MAVLHGRIAHGCLSFKFDGAPREVNTDNCAEIRSAEQIEPSMKIQYAMVMVSDMEQATAFYRDVIGFTLKFQTPGWTEFENEGATLALHPTASPALERAAGDDSAGAVRLGFSVRDLDEFHERVLSKGVRCIQPPTEQFGVRLARYEGPDNLVFSVGGPPSS